MYNAIIKCKNNYHKDDKLVIKELAKNEIPIVKIKKLHYDNIKIKIVIPNQFDIHKMIIHLNEKADDTIIVEIKKSLIKKIYNIRKIK